MSMVFVSASLAVHTATKFAAYRVDFTPGLNVIEAPNSWGKSTLIQSLVYGLGLEGSFSTSHLSPLGEAMSSSIELEDQRQAVLESYVTLTLRNNKGDFLRTRRWATSLRHSSHLIQTWSASREEDLDTQEPVDTYVREPGGATNDLGFHHVLETFLGWDLPLVPSFNTNETRLYLEVLFPLFYVEQKYGWSGLGPRVPTHYRIRSAYRRAAEYVLGFNSLERTRVLEQARLRQAAAREAVEIDRRSLEVLLLRNGWRLAEPIEATLARGDDDAITAEGSVDGEWTPVEKILESLAERSLELNALPIAIAGDRSAQALQSLRVNETRAVELSVRLRRERETVDSLSADRDTLQNRLRDLDLDREHLADIRKLERLGSELSLSSLATAHCPTCAQSLDSAHVATGIVLDVAANIDLLNAERATVNHLLEVENGRTEAASARAERTWQDLSEVRSAIRALKDELSGQSGAPSINQVRERLELESRIVSIRNASADVESAAESLIARLRQLATLEASVRALSRSEGDEEDAKTLRILRSAFQSELTSYGFSSLPVNEVTIGEATLLPEHDGFELTFDINHGLSASDTIRAKWAVYTALSRAAIAAPAAHHLGVLILDEPRQQEAQLTSVAALYAELADLGDDIQVIVASSASTSDLDAALDGVTSNRIRPGTPHLLQEVSASSPDLA